MAGGLNKREIAMDTIRQKPGFILHGKRVYYVDPQGKDISFDRWRISAYYHRNMALTEFFTTKKDYDFFVETTAPFAYQNVDDFEYAFANRQPDVRYGWTS
jgi:hypothetical protein